MTGLSLDMFKPRVVEVEVLDSMGNVVLSVSLATLSWADYQAEVMSLPEVPVPMKRGVKNGQVAEVPDFDNKEYQKAVRDRGDKIMKQLVVQCLMRAGNLPELASATMEERLEALGQFDSGILKTLQLAVDDMLTGARKRLKSVAANFPANNGAHPEDMPG